jgi:transcriptional regulator with XRE-family HTH domain
MTHTQIVEFSPRNEKQPVDDQPLHRVAEVRQQQGVSLRTAARHMNTDMATVRLQEKPTTDMRLSELAAWQQVLDVPLSELLVDPGAPLSRPVMERARLVRLMKTAASIKEKSDSIELKRLAKTLTDQLIEIMPELAEVSPWHSVGQRRSLDEVGRVAERRLRDDFFVVYRED